MLSFLHPAAPVKTAAMRVAPVNVIEKRMLESTVIVFEIGKKQRFEDGEKACEIAVRVTADRHKRKVRKTM